MIEHADTLAASQASGGWTNIVANHGGNVALSGLSVVFLGLILIAATIWLFNRFIGSSQPANREVSPVVPATGPAISSSAIPEDHLVAIATAIELYRRLHFDLPESKITFKRGETHDSWKAGYRFGQRQSLR